MPKALKEFEERERLWLSRDKDDYLWVHMKNEAGRASIFIAEPEGGHGPIISKVLAAAIRAEIGHG